MNTLSALPVAATAVAITDTDAESGTTIDSSGSIDLRLDDRPHRVPAGTTLADLVERLGHRPPDVASAVNGSFVPRSQRAACVLQGGDAVLLFKPIVGG
jgi:sulfur carrier protein